MRFRSKFFCLMILIVPFAVYAQTESKLTVPVSPAFSILNFEPSAVMRPTTGKALSSDILNAFDKEGKLLINLGLEVMPYWLSAHPTLNFNEYINPTLGQTFLQSFSISAATVKDSVSGNNKLGAGFRFKIFNGKPADVTGLNKITEQIQASNTVIAILNGFKTVVLAGAVPTRTVAITQIDAALRASVIDTQLLLDVSNNEKNILNNYTDSPTDINLFLDKLMELRESAGRETAKKASDMIYQRKGFIVELAGASGFNTSKNNSLDKGGLWSNISYTLAPDDYLTLTMRYMYNTMDTIQTNFDAGLGFLKKTRDFNVSAEVMLRHQSAELPDININNQSITRIEKSMTYRLAVQGSFKINEGVSVNLSFGKDFDSPFISRSGFFSILGLNYSIFNENAVKMR